MGELLIAVNPRERVPQLYDDEVTYLILYISLYRLYKGLNC